MYWVVKWATLRKPKLIRIGPIGAPCGTEESKCPNERPQPTWTIKESPTNEDLGLSSLLSSMKAHRRAKAQQAYPASKQAQVHGPLDLSKFKAHQRWLLTWNHAKDPQPVNHAILTFQPIGQSRYPYLSINPFDSASAAVYNLGPLPWCLQLNLFSSDGKNPRNTFNSSCSYGSEWHHSYTRESDAAHSAAKGGRFLPPKNASSTIRAQQAA